MYEYISHCLLTFLSNHIILPTDFFDADAITYNDPMKQVYSLIDNIEFNVPHFNFSENVPWPSKVQPQIPATIDELCNGDYHTYQRFFKGQSAVGEQEG